MNGCISNPIVGTSNYSLTWNSNYPQYKGRDITQTNRSEIYYSLNGNSLDYLDKDLLSNYHFYHKDTFDTGSVGIGVIGNFRPIIEYRE